MSYQDPHFSKEAYWKWRNDSNPEERRGLRRLMNKRGYSLGTEAQIGNKPVSKKALRKNTKRARKVVN